MPDPLEDYDSEDDDDYVPDDEADADGNIIRLSGGPKRKSKAARVPGRRQGGMLFEGEVDVAEDGDKARDKTQTALANSRGGQAEAGDRSHIDSLGAELSSADPDKMAGAASAGEPEGPGPKRPAVDDLWAEMNAGAAPKKPVAKPSSATGAGGFGFSWGARAGGKRTQDASRSPAEPRAAGTHAETACTADAGPSKYNVPGIAPSKRVGFITITETKDFAGEMIETTRDVRIGSKEELALRVASGPAASQASLGSGLKAAQAFAAVKALTGHSAKQGEAGASAAPGSTAAAESRACRASAAGKPGGMAALLATIDKPKKMSTMEKTQLDWQKFKTTQDREEVEAMEKFTKDGYLERRAFMRRMDERQHEVARDVRRRRMGIQGD